MAVPSVNHSALRKWGAECRGKTQFKSRRAALAALRVMIKEGRANNSSLHEYKCPACKYWHLGNRRPLPAPLKQIRAAIGDTVEIIWRTADGKELRTIHHSPKEPT